jgi:subtilisin family serine protease
MHRLIVASVLIAIICGFSATAARAVTPSSAPQPVRKIVVLDPALREQAVRELLSRHGASQAEALPLIHGMVAYLPNAAAARALEREAGVLSVEDDIVIHALAKPAPVPVAQAVPWGVLRILAPVVWGVTTGDPVKVGIIDTGIDVSHPDLSGNLKGGVSCVAYASKYTDDNGHGTHVAGIVAAVDNGYGVVGVAPQADLYAIKVLDRRGSGYLSDIIRGMDWAVVNGMHVVNMSLGTNTYSAAFALAAERMARAGVVQVAAAGNDGPGADTVDYPGAFPHVLAVGATASNDVIASFSSRGAQVAVAAPGVSIHSTYKNGAYATLSGTSMAASHVTGTVALVLTRSVGTWDVDGDGRWDPDELGTCLRRTSLDRGPTGSDTAYGAGLVRVDKAVAL